VWNCRTMPSGRWTRSTPGRSNGDDGAPKPCERLPLSQAIRAHQFVDPGLFPGQRDPPLGRTKPSSQPTILKFTSCVLSGSGARNLAVWNCRTMSTRKMRHTRTHTHTHTHTHTYRAVWNCRTMSTRKMRSTWFGVEGLGFRV